MKGPFHSMDAAENEFKKKFSDKTKNKWEERDNFTPVAGKYTLLEMDDDDDVSYFLLDIWCEILHHRWAGLQLKEMSQMAHPRKLNNVHWTNQHKN